MRRAVEFEAGGVRHQLRFSTGALMAVEAETGQPFSAAVQRLNAGADVRVSDIVMFFRCALNGGRETVEVAADLVDDLGLARAGQLLGEAIQVAFPAPEAGKAKPGKATQAAA